MGSRLILGIDNSIDYLNIALSLEENLIEERNIRSKRSPSEIIGVKVSEVLTDHGYTARDVNLLVATLGPGSFTGIRVGLSFCKGMAAPRNIPLIGVPTLDVLAAPLSFMETFYLCPVLDAKKGEVFLSLYRGEGGYLKRLSPYGSVKPDKVPAMLKRPCILFGTGAGLCKPFLNGVQGVTVVEGRFSAISGETLIRQGLRQGVTGDAVPLKPIYGRRSEAEIKFNVDLT
jgi:tRNA threonylcarbamoyladenosine biosynthesis protein TsaB